MGVWGNVRRRASECGEVGGESKGVGGKMRACPCAHAAAGGSGGGARAREDARPCEGRGASAD